jgi:hypothetical protein
MKKIMSALPRGAPPKKRQIEEKSDAVDETKFKTLKKKARTLCNIEGCTKQAVNGGVCIAHGATKKARTLCNIEGCTKQAVNGGVCIAHGAKRKKKLCSIEGCDKQAVNGRVCIKHGATKKRCSIEGCDKQAPDWSSKPV